MFVLVDKKFILNLARKSILHYLSAEKKLEIEPDKVSESLRVKSTCFVTLTINGQLRGCMGHIEATQPLYLDIIESAVKAGFEDKRFSPLTKEEFKNVDIEVSILTTPRRLDFVSPDDLINKLHPGVDGVIIRRGRAGATYLPQVWDELSDKKEFLSSLCLKAGLTADDWKKSGLEVEIYGVEVIKE